MTNEKLAYMFTGDTQRNVSSDTDFSQEEQAWEVLVYAGTSCVLSSMNRTPPPARQP